MRAHILEDHEEDVRPALLACANRPEESEGEHHE
jgi:hypothetical protein